MDRIFKYNIVFNSILAGVASIIWFFLIGKESYLVYEKTNDSSIFLYLLYPIFLLIGALLGILAFKSHGKKQLKFTYIQIAIYFLDHHFYGIGDEYKYRSLYSTICLLIMFELLVFIVHYESKISKRPVDTDYQHGG